LDSDGDGLPDWWELYWFGNLLPTAGELDANGNTFLYDYQNSLFVQWSTHQRRPGQVTTTTFQTVMAENHRATAMRFVLAKHPSLKNLS
jgi:hypothetical protein